MTFVQRLWCQDVELKVGHKTLLQQVKIELNASESIALTGPNGLGKTTLLRCFAGVSRPHFGQVKVLGQEIWPNRITDSETRAVFLTSQPALLSEHSVLGNLEFMCNSFGLRPLPLDLHKALERVGLSGRESQVSRTLSTGQKRRLTLAFVIVIKPNLLLSDEPTNGLDASGTELCQAIFKEQMQHFGMALAVATHDERLIAWCQKVMPLETFLPKKTVGKKQILGSILQ